MLDRLMREKPNALMIALEGMIMCAKNEMSEWRDSLDDVKRSQYMDYARNLVREQRRELHERQERIREFKVCKWNERQEKAAEREVNERERVTKLTEELVSDGGLWKCESEIIEMNERLNGKSEKEQMVSLRVQLKLMKCVLKVKNKEGLLNFSRMGKALSLEELKKNMRELLKNEKGNSGRESCQQDGGERNLDGKLVKHYRNDRKGAGEQWFVGTVKRKGGKFLIKYNGDSCNTEWEFSEAEISNDLEGGDLVILNVEAKDYVGRRIKHGVATMGKRCGGAGG
ncbi:hypothetical protein HOLleu_30640 [Holothuria leucospilota]|uniref:Uncharacterized protein n=1 Tax=Holothuria leucospilota TaxID=206669 RepID=A0A9Q1BKP5_HOLLE|nr:hypothetical protein HOLleu_30640 [Holothuria leucospilota]